MAVKKKVSIKQGAAKKKSAVSEQATAKKKSVVKKVLPNKGAVAKTFADAGAKVDHLLQRGQKRLKAIQEQVTELEEKSRAFLAHPSSNATIKKIQDIGEKANRSRQQILKATDKAHRKHAKAVLKGDLKAAREHMSDMTALGNALKGIFKLNPKK